MVVTWRARFAGWRRAHGRMSAGGRMVVRLPTVGVPKMQNGPPTDGADWGGHARPISEPDLHGYIDGDLAAVDHLDVETFLAAHPLIAERVETYRSEIIAVNAAFRAGEKPLPPALAQLARRYTRAVRTSSRVGTALGIIGLVALLCVVAETARGAYG